MGKKKITLRNHYSIDNAISSCITVVDTIKYMVTWPPIDPFLGYTIRLVYKLLPRNGRYREGDRETWTENR